MLPYENNPIVSVGADIICPSILYKFDWRPMGAATNFNRFCRA